MKLAELAATATVASCAALMPSVASADSHLHVDATSDVVRYDSRDSPPTAVPDRTEGDIRSIRVTHLDRTLRVALNFRQLSRTGIRKDATLRIRTDQGLREIRIYATSATWRGGHDIADGRRYEVSCKGLTHSWDYERNKLLVVVPRRCLESPHWVRVAARITMLDETEEQTARSASPQPFAPFYFDNPRSGRAPEEPFRATPIYGPRVYR